MTLCMKNRYLNYFITQSFSMSALLLIYLAHSYMTIGNGLNPFIALPIATLFIIEPYIRHQYFNIY